MNFYIVIPAHNEAEFIGKTLKSLTDQSLLPKKIVVVNDHSTDDTEKIVKAYAEEYAFIDYINISSNEKHLPGSKIINAFYKGLESLDDHFDVICKYDADLIFPKNYLESIKDSFTTKPNIGICGGICTVKKKEQWVNEGLTNNDHVRGALKAYSKHCFEKIGGLKPSIGWDTVDELLAKYNNYEVKVLTNLRVKHLRPTGKSYAKKANHKQGEAFYKMRYGWPITFIAALKLAFKKKQGILFIDYCWGYLKAKQQKSPLLVSEKEGQWIRKYRWQGILKKLKLNLTPQQSPHQ